jgi:ABC-three component (ABC-3C) system Middle Component 6
MIIPTKAITPDRALLSVSAQVLKQLDSPTTIDQTWTRLRAWREANGQASPISFGWFVLACDLLYALGALDLQDGLLIRSIVDAP